MACTYILNWASMASMVLYSHACCIFSNIPSSFLPPQPYLGTCIGIHSQAMHLTDDKVVPDAPYLTALRDCQISMTVHKCMHVYWMEVLSIFITTHALSVFLHRYIGTCLIQPPNGQFYNNIFDFAWRVSCFTD